MNPEEGVSRCVSGRVTKAHNEYFEVEIRRSC